MSMGSTLIQKQIVLKKKNEVPVKDDLPLNKSKKSWAKDKIQPNTIEELL